MEVPACVPCWNGPSCRWLSVGACRFGHFCRQADDGSDDLVDLAEQVRELRVALAKLAAAVMWRTGAPVSVPVPQIVEDAVTIIPKERISERTSDTDVFEDCESPAGAVHRMAPHERVQQRTVEHRIAVDVPTPQILEEIVEAGSAPHERVQQRTVEHRMDVDVPTPQILEEIVEAGSAPHERVQQRTVEHRIAVDVPTPQILEEIVEADSAPHERVQQRTVEHRIAVDVPTPQILEEIGEAGLAPHERVQQRTVEQRIAVDVPTPRILEEIVEAISAPHERVQQRTVEHVETVKNIPQERISERICAQFVDGPVSHSQPQILEEVVEVVRAVKKGPSGAYV